MSEIRANIINSEDGTAAVQFPKGQVVTGIVTATSFVGDGSSLTGAGPTLANGSNDRVVTATGANGLNGEANLTFNSSNILTATETGTGNGMGGISAATASAGGNAGYGFMTNSANRFAVTTIGSAGAESLRIYDDNNNAERLRIGDAGQFGIGGANYGTSGQVLLSGGASAAPSWGAAPGISNIDQWHLTTNQALSSADPLTGWTHSTNAANGRKGTAMTESSGVFSFPSTGMWEVSFSCWYYANARSSRWMQSRINSTENNSSYNQASAASNAIYNTGSNGYNSAYSKFIYDVTSTTNCKIRFSVDSQATLQYMGGRNFTAVKFIRLTDT